MRKLFLAAVLTALTASASPAGDAPTFFRGAYVTPVNRPVSQYTAVRVYRNGQAVERTVSMYYNNPAPRYVDRPGAVVPDRNSRGFVAPAYYPVVTSPWTWSSPSAYQP